MTGWIESFLDLNREQMAEVVKDLMVSEDREVMGFKEGYEKWKGPCEKGLIEVVGCLYLGL